MTNVQLLVSKEYDNQMEISTSTNEEDISMARYFQNISLIHHVKMVLVIRASIENGSVNGS